MHYGSVPFDMNTLRRGYPTTDNGFCLTPNVTQGRSRGTVRLRSQRLPGPAARRPALLHRSRGLRRADHADRCETGPHDRRAGAAGRMGRAANSRRDPTRRPTTNFSTTSTSATTPSITRRRRREWVRSATRWRFSIRSCGSRAYRQAAGGRRIRDAETALGQPQHHGDDDGGEVCPAHPRELTP